MASENSANVSASANNFLKVDMVVFLPANWLCRWNDALAGWCNYLATNSWIL